MATSEKVPAEVMEKIAEGPAGSKEYLAQKKRCLANFSKHLVEIENDNRSIEDLVKVPGVLETYTKNYFFGIRVQEVLKDKMTGKLTKTGRSVLPKMGYSRNIKAVLFGVFTREFKVCFFIFKTLGQDLFSDQPGRSSGFPQSQQLVDKVHPVLEKGRKGDRDSQGEAAQQVQWASHGSVLSLPSGCYNDLSDYEY